MQPRHAGARRHHPIRKGVDSTKILQILHKRVSVHWTGHGVMHLSSKSEPYSPTRGKAPSTVQ